jgi:hypothetical protein
MAGDSRIKDLTVGTLSASDQFAVDSAARAVAARVPFSAIALLSLTSYVRSDVVNIVEGGNVIAFSSDIGVANYVVLCSAYNAASGESVQVTVTARTTAGFTVMSADSAQLEYIAIKRI